MEKEETIRNSQRRSDLQEFYLILDKLHSGAFESESPELVDAIAKEKLKLIEEINLTQFQQ